MGVSLLCNTYYARLFCSDVRWHDIHSVALEYRVQDDYDVYLKEEEKRIIIRRGGEGCGEIIDLGMKCTFQREET